MLSRLAVGRNELLKRQGWDVNADGLFGAPNLRVVVGDPPPVRSSHALAYDASAGKVILFGGYGFDGSLNDTWAYDYASNNWTNRNPANPPPVRDAHALAPTM